MLSENLPHLGWLGYIFPTFIYELICQICLGSNQNAIIQGFWKVRKFVSVHVEWTEQFVFFQCHVFHLASIELENIAVEYRNNWLMQNVTGFQMYSNFESCHFHHCNIKELKHSPYMSKKGLKLQKSIITGCD